VNSGMAISLIVGGALQVTVVTVTVRVALFLIHVSDVTILVDCWLVAPRFQLNTYGRRAFAVAAPATWNTLSDELRNPDLHSATFRRNLKTFLFRQYLAH